jgi:hypothetical protein
MSAIVSLDRVADEQTVLRTGVSGYEMGDNPA